jgi:hypothetical protein
MSNDDLDELIEEELIFTELLLSTLPKPLLFILLKVISLPLLCGHHHLVVRHMSSSLKTAKMTGASKKCYG